MANLAASRAAHEPDFSHRERREVVMQHEALFGFPFKALQSLHVVAGAKRSRNQRLRLAASKDCAAVRPRQNAGFDPDLADLVELASVRTPLVVDDLIAEDALPQNLVVLLDL